MGKPIQQGKKPPYFRECPICHKEFGSRSLEIHMSRCLERQKSSSDQESDVNENSVSTKSPKKSSKSPLRIKGLKQNNAKILTKQKTITSDEDDEVETSLSDELNHSWPSTKAISHRNKIRRPNGITRTLQVKNRRKRERKKEYRSEANTSSGDEASRPKTATLKRPHILDESLKDKVDMTLTKKEFLAAVKLCTDAAVQRGHPNMKVKAIRSHMKAVSTPNYQPVSTPNHQPNKGFQSQNTNSNTSSPYMSKILGKIKKKVIPESGSPTKSSLRVTEIRPQTTKLERPSNISLDLPQINVKPQVVISKSLSRHMKLKNKIKKTIEDTKKEPEIRLQTVGKQQSNQKNNNSTKDSNKGVLNNHLPKDKVPEPCKSCGRSDFPERLHTHINDNNNIKTSKMSPTKKMGQKPVQSSWLSPKATNKNRQRALSLDTAVIEPLALTATTNGGSNTSVYNGSNNTSLLENTRETTAGNGEQLGKNSVGGNHKKSYGSSGGVGDPKQMQKSVKAGSMASLRVVDISDEMTDMEMSNNDSSDGDKGVIVSEVNLTKRPPALPNNKDSSTRMSVDESSSANESSSGATTPPITNSKSSTNKNLKKLKRPPAPSLTSKTNQKNLEQNGGSNQNNSNNQVPEIISNNNKEVTDNNNVLGLVTCAVCGKQFGKNSVKFHTRQCQKRQQIIKERQVTSDEKKTSPSAVSEPIEEVEDVVPVIHETIWEAHVQQLIPCGRCGRTFFPDRIKKHQDSCKAPKKGLTVKVATNNGSSMLPNSNSTSRAGGTQGGPMGTQLAPKVVEYIPPPLMSTNIAPSPSVVNQSSPTVPPPAAAASISGSPTPLPVQGSVPLPVSVLAPNLNPAIDLLRADPLLLMNSPSMIRRTLHRHDDTVIAAASNYEESMLKQIQPNKKTVE